MIEIILIILLAWFVTGWAALEYICWMEDGVLWSTEVYTELKVSYDKWKTYALIILIPLAFPLVLWYYFKGYFD